MRLQRKRMYFLMERYAQLLPTPIVLETAICITNRLTGFSKKAISRAIPQRIHNDNHILINKDRIQYSVALHFNLSTAFIIPHYPA